jgi:formylglycine-generating enzyme required for sulfatase activity
MAKTYCEMWRGARLPTEAEWEKAARGTDGRSYPWGTCSIDHTYTDYIFEWGDLYDTKPVGSYEKGISIYGVYDMMGSLSEWVNDWFAETYDSNVLSNPQGPESGLYRVVRGYSSDRNAIRVTNRIGYGPTENIGYVGFRCASDGTSQLQASLTQVVYPPTPTKTPDPSDYMDQAGIRMRLVPAGSFVMGSDKGQADEAPMHTVHLDAYYIDTYEVTNASYKTCVAAGVCQASRARDLAGWLAYSELPIFDDYPAAVDWEEAKTFCEWREAQLPTEAQWEKAARGTNGRTYPWGEGADCSKANFHDQNVVCAGNPVQVGSFEDGKSVYGLYDMAGNILEWVADWYSETYYQESPAVNPSGPDFGTLRVLRGGGYYSDALYIRSSARIWTMPNVTGYGFRCVKPAA